MTEEIASIKKPGEVEYISKEEYQNRVKEIIRCKRDIKYFAEKYFKIVNLDTGLTTIKLYPKQRELLDFLCNEDRGVVLSARQSSKTTTYTIFALWYTQFFPEKKIMILCNKASVMVEVISRIQLAYQYLPRFLKSAAVVWNKTEIEFGNHSSIKGFPASSDSARGFSANCVFWDEAGFTPNNLADKIFTSIYPVISTSKKSKFFQISTPNGVDPRQVFYDTYTKAKNKENKEGWKLFEFYWYDVPMRDDSWKEKTIASIGAKRFAQEFNNEFLTSDTVKKLIPDDIIEKYRRQYSDFKAKNMNQGKELAIISQDGKKTFTFRMYQKFDPDRTYLCSSDIAEGIGKDSSVLYMWDITDTSNIRMVAKFSDNSISLIEFAYVTYKICQMYNNPFLACESNGLAIGYIEQLRQTYEYDNFVRMNRDNGCGIQSHVQVKSRACLWARDMLTTVGFGFELNDLNLIDEMGTFIKKDTRVQNVYAAIGDNHDDHLMTLIWACWILNPENIEKYYVVGDTFTSSLGNVYPRTIGSLFECTREEYQKILEIPQVREFMTYEELHKDEFKMLEDQSQKSQTDTMKFLKQNVLVGNDPQKDPNRMVYSLDPAEMTREMRKQNMLKNDDSGLIFGTGSSIAGNPFFGDDFGEKMW